MQIPGGVSIAFLAYVGVLLPWGAIRSKRVIDALDDEDTGSKLTRPSMYVSTLVSLVILFGFSWAAGRTFDFELFATPKLGLREATAGFIALAVQFALMLVARAIHPPDERRKMAVYKIIPHTRKEWSLWIPVCIAAGLAEEAAYRGVLVAILRHSLGSLEVAWFVSATIFAVSHAVQGWRSGVVIFAMALSMQALALYTGTLVVGMVVHAVYDVGAGMAAAWRMKTDKV